MLQNDPCMACWLLLCAAACLFEYDGHKWRSQEAYNVHDVLIHNSNDGCNSKLGALCCKTTPCKACCCAQLPFWVVTMGTNGAHRRLTLCTMS